MYASAANYSKNLNFSEGAADCCNNNNTLKFFAEDKGVINSPIKRINQQEYANNNNNCSNINNNFQ